jgi:hypothetical protein
MHRAIVLSVLVAMALVLSVLVVMVLVAVAAAWPKALDATADDRMASRRHVILAGWLKSCWQASCAHPRARASTHNDASARREASLQHRCPVAPDAKQRGPPGCPHDGDQ